MNIGDFDSMHICVRVSDPLGQELQTVVSCLGPLEVQPVFSTAEPSLQSLDFIRPKDNQNWENQENWQDTKHPNDLVGWGGDSFKNRMFKLKTQRKW